MACGPATAAAPAYHITQGQGYTVCEAFKRELAGRGPDDLMVCQAELKPGSLFSRPDWQSLSLDKPDNLALFRQLDQIARRTERSPVNDEPRAGNYPRVGELTAEQWQRDFAWRQQQPAIGQPRLLKAKLGLDGEGEDETVVAVTWGAEECQARVEQGGGAFFDAPYTLFLYDEARQQVDLDSPQRLTLGQASRDHDVLIFQRRAFFYTSYYLPGRYSNVYLETYGDFPGGGATISRCRYEMNLRNSNAKPTRK